MRTTLYISFTGFLLCCLLGIESLWCSGTWNMRSLPCVPGVDLPCQSRSCGVNQALVSSPQIYPSEWNSTAPCQVLLPGRCCQMARSGDTARPEDFSYALFHFIALATALSLSSRSWFESSFYTLPELALLCAPLEVSAPASRAGPPLRGVHPSSTEVLLQAAGGPAQHQLGSPPPAPLPLECSLAPCS